MWKTKKFSKNIEYKNYTLILTVQLNTTQERRIGGYIWHTITAREKNFKLPEEKYEVENEVLEQKINTIIKEFKDQVDGIKEYPYDPKTIELLTNLGFE